MDTRIGQHAEQQVAMHAMGEMAWPTVALGISLVTAYIGVLAAVGLGAMPVGLACLAISIIVYAIYTVVHEAVHGSVCGKHKSLSWLNELLGYLGGQVIGAPLTAHRKEHIDHHRHTNVHHHDPDLRLVGGSVGTVILGALRALPLQIQHYATRHWSQSARQDRLVLCLELIVMVLWRAAFVAWVGWSTGLLVLVAANLLGIFLILVLFAWIVHWPHSEAGRYRNTATFTFPGIWDHIVSALWLFQNYHSVHHLYPRVPFYRYRQVFRGIEGHMEDNNAPITRFGQRT